MSEDKQFEPTARRREKARERGEVPQSRDFTAAGLLLATSLAAPSLVGHITRHLTAASSLALGHLHEFEATGPVLRQSLTQWGQLLATALTPLLGLTLGCAVVLTYFQTGPLLTAQPLLPRWDRVNPVQVLKRLFSLRGLVETLKSLLKVGLVALVVYLTLRREGEHLLTLGQMELGTAVAELGRVARELCLKTGLLMLVLGAADYAYQRFEHNRSLRMTREEMRQETKESEGDPNVRSRRRQRRQALLRDGMSPRMPQATVVVTNPTHVAVALYYQPGQTEAPVVVARGRGWLAQRIRATARRYGIPLHEDPPLARALYQSCSLGAAIPGRLYRVVALILAEMQRRRQRPS